jgi:AraC-like DNA-binding protein
MPIDLPEGVYSGFSIYGNDVFVPGINSLGEHWSSPRLKQESKKLKNYTLLLQLEGECSFNINGKREELSNGNLLLISSGAIMERLEQRYSYNHCLWIGFSMRQALQDEPELLKDWDDFTFVKQPFLPKHKSLVKTIVNEHASPGQFSEQIARNAFRAFVYAIQELVHGAATESALPSSLTQNPTVLLAIDLFEREYSELWDLKKLSDRLAVSESKLTKAFRTATGESPMASLWKIRLIKGYELLTTSSLNITQIAMMVGFQSSQSFATAFKRSFRATPRDVKTGNVQHVEPRTYLQEKGK